MDISVNAIFEKTSCIIDKAEARQAQVTEFLFARAENMSVKLVATRAPALKEWIDTKAKLGFSTARKLNKAAQDISVFPDFQIPTITNSDFAPIGINE